MTLPSRSFTLWNGDASGHGQHPAHFAETLLGVNQVGDCFDMRFVLFHPVAAGEARIQNPVLHIPRHFLRANQHALDFGIVDRRKIRAAAGRDIETGFTEKIDSGVFQAAFRECRVQLHRCCSVNRFRDRRRFALSPPTRLFAAFGRSSSHSRYGRRPARLAPPGQAGRRHRNPSRSLSTAGNGRSSRLSSRVSCATG